LEWATGEINDANVFTEPTSHLFDGFVLFLIELGHLLGREHAR
jgi:hypothetical protein